MTSLIMALLLANAAGAGELADCNYIIHHIGIDDRGPRAAGTDHPTFQPLPPDSCADLESKLPSAHPRPVPSVDNSLEIIVPPSFVPNLLDSATGLPRRETYKTIREILPRALANTQSQDMFHGLGYHYNPQALLIAMIKTESEFDTGALSAAGARGLAQATPETFFMICHEYRQHFHPTVAKKCGPIALKISAYRATKSKVKKAYLKRELKEIYREFFAEIAKDRWQMLGFHVIYMKVLTNGFRKTNSLLYRIRTGFDPVTQAVAAYHGGPDDIEEKMTDTRKHPKTAAYWRKVLGRYDTIMRYSEARRNRI